MVLCCVPSCGVDSFFEDNSITFHEFPSNPDLAAKWIQQINAALPFKGMPKWFPRGKPSICSKHFLHTDFKEDSDSLKPRSIPTVFGHKYIGITQTIDTTENTAKEAKKQPLIVKVNRPSPTNLVISEVFSQNESVVFDTISPTSSPEKTLSAVSSHSKSVTSGNNKEQQNKLYLSEKLNESLRNILNKGRGVSAQKSINTSSASSLNADRNVKLQTYLNSSQGNLSSNHGKNFIKSPTGLSKKNLNASKGLSINKGNQKLPEKVSSTHNYQSRRKKATGKDIKHELIEIGPNTFLKINPEVIKINKKQTPSGNTVLQFVMDQKLARNQNPDMLPKIVHMSPGKAPREETVSVPQSVVSKSATTKEPEATVQHILGHLVDTNDEDCVISDEANRPKRPCTIDQETLDIVFNPPVITEVNDKSKNADGSLGEASNKMDTGVIAKAPVLFKTSKPLSHYTSEKSRLLTQLKQKGRQIGILKDKLDKFQKKVEELEDRCIVQERQLSFSFVKRLRQVKRDATKGDPCAVYLLEQIKCHTRHGNKMRWSDTTLAQCAVWCKKAPYAYEYFKKSDFFKLPCLGTVRRFMKKHPDIVLQTYAKQPPKGQDESSSSSDFDFDETDSEKEGGQRDKSTEETVACETILTECNSLNEAMQSESNENGTDTNMDAVTSTTTEAIAVEGTSVEIQEIVLPSGEVVQCYSQNFANGMDSDNQYYIIPNVDARDGVGGEHQFNVVQATDETLPEILKNLENSHLPHEQQLIFITNSSEQMECTETEVTTAHSSKSS